MVIKLEFGVSNSIENVNIVNLWSHLSLIPSYDTFTFCQSVILVYVYLYGYTVCEYELRVLLLSKV